MAIALVAHTLQQGNVAGTGNSSPIATTGANLLTIYTVQYATTALAPTDSLGNTWTGRTNYYNGTTSSRIFDCLNPTVGAAHTFASNHNSYDSISVAAWSGVATSGAFDVGNGDISGTFGPTINTGSVTPGQDGSLLFFGVGDNWSASTTTTVGTILDQAVIIGGNSFANADAYEIQTTATTRNPQFTVNSRAGATIAVYKPALVATVARHNLVLLGVGG